MATAFNLILIAAILKQFNKEMSTETENILEDRKIKDFHMDEDTSSTEDIF
jgi:hypothetical protein